MSARTLAPPRSRSPWSSPGRLSFPSPYRRALRRRRRCPSTRQLLFLQAAPAPCTGMSDNRPFRSEGLALGGYGSERGAGGSGHGFCQTEIQQLRTGLHQHDVAGLNVSMSDTLPMGPVQSVGHLSGNFQQLLSWHRAALEPMGEGLTVQVFEHDKVDAVLQRRCGDGLSWQPRALRVRSAGGARDCWRDAQAEPLWPRCGQGGCPGRDRPRPSRPRRAVREFRKARVSSLRRAPSITVSVTLGR